MEPLPVDDDPVDDLAGGPVPVPTDPPPEPPVVWDVALRLRLNHAAQPFALDVAFRSTVQRLVLFGPSGAGKSLTLKAMAGLLKPESGHVEVTGERLFDSARGLDRAPQRRGLGYVFQDYALFPHLSVRQNVAFGCMHGWRNPGRRGRDEAEAQVRRWLDAFELEDLADRYPDQLSGGQRQRTALARALAAAPSALLLDEPFAALDAHLRARLRAELVQLQSRLAIPMAMITHDPADVQAFADEVVVLEAGRVVRTGPPMYR